MNTSKQKIKEGIILAISFLTTIGIVLISYGTYNALNPVNVGSGLTASSWNQMIDNISYLKNFTDNYGGVGSVLQIVSNQNSSFIRNNNTIPYGTTAPIQTQGVEVSSVTITPKYSNSKILIEGMVHAVEESNSADHVTIAIFKDSDVNALASATHEVSGDFSVYNGLLDSLPIRFDFIAGTTSPITFKIRAGLDGGYININGSNGISRLGGTLYSGITVTEIKQ